MSNETGSLGLSLPSYPDINIKLVGEDGNAFSILGRVERAMRKAGRSQEEINVIQAEMTAGDYNHLLVTVMKCFSVDTEDEDEDGGW